MLKGWQMIKREKKFFTGYMEKNKQSDIDKYKKQRNRVNNLKKIAKEHFEENLDNIILENISNSKTYWKIMKMLIKSNKGCSNIPPLQNIIQDEGLDEIVYGDDEKCELLNKYFSFLFLHWKMQMFLFQT
jgi:hypothetical protein